MLVAMMADRCRDRDAPARDLLPGDGTPDRQFVWGARIRLRQPEALRRAVQCPERIVLLVTAAAACVRRARLAVAVRTPGAGIRCRRDRVPRCATPTSWPAGGTGSSVAASGIAASPTASRSLRSVSPACTPGRGRRTTTAAAVACVACVAVALSVFQMLQYWTGVLPFSDTTWDQYRAVFLRMK